MRDCYRERTSERPCHAIVVGEEGYTNQRLKERQKRASTIVEEQMELCMQSKLKSRSYKIANDKSGWKRKVKELGLGCRMLYGNPQR